jgi:hypothetical protein
VFFTFNLISTNYS